MQNFNTKAQFFTDLANEAGHEINKGMYNLILSIQELKLWSKGIKTHSNQKLMHYKDYFGIKGDCNTMLQELQDLNTIIKLHETK